MADTLFAGSALSDDALVDLVDAADFMSGCTVKSGQWSACAGVEVKVCLTITHFSA